MSAQPLDEAAVAELTSEFMLAVRAHYLRRPTARSTAQEVLNATAIVAAHIIAAAREADDETSARDFFDLAFENQLAQLASDYAERRRAAS